MKIGTSIWAIPDWSLEKTFKTISEIGYDGIELAFDEKGIVSAESSAKDLDGVKALAAEYNLELYSLSSGLGWNYSLTSDDASVREKAKSFVKKQLETASYLGCDTILVVPGYTHVDFIPNCPVVDYETAYERACEWVDELKPVAEKLKVCIGVENVWNKFLLSPLEMRNFIDRADSDYVGSYFDVGNVLNVSFPEHWIKALGHRIKKVHLKDFSRAVGNLSGFIGLLDGDVNYPAVMKALKEVGYDGWLTAETDICANYPEYGIKKTYDAIKTIING